MKHKMIPGCTYMTTKGVEVLYLGYGRFWSEQPGGGVFLDVDKRHIYIKMHEFEKKLQNGMISKDLKTYCGNPKTLGFWTMIYTAMKPKPLKDGTPIRTLFPPDYFKNLVIEDETPENGQCTCLSYMLAHIETEAPC